MNPLDALVSSRGYITRPEILDCGYDDLHIRDALKTGHWAKIGPGLYTDDDSYRKMRPEQQHLLRCRARLHRLGDSVVLTHQSASIVHQIAVWGVDLELVNVTRLDNGHGRQEAGVFHHVGIVNESEIEEVDGLLVVKAPRAVWETACTTGTETGLVTADSALHQKIVTPDELEEVASTFDSWQGSRAARLTLRLADGRAASPGESRTRHLFWRFGIPRPELQYEVRDASGRLIAYTDFGWPEYCHVAEFDGRVKYDGTFGDGTQALVDEKTREDEVRAENLGMSRVVWRQLDPPNDAHTARRVLKDMERSRRLYARNRVTIAI